MATGVDRGQGDLVGARLGVGVADRLALGRRAVPQVPKESERCCRGHRLLPGIFENGPVLVSIVADVGQPVWFQDQGGMAARIDPLPLPGGAVVVEVADTFDGAVEGDPLSFRNCDSQIRSIVERGDLVAHLARPG